MSSYFPLLPTFKSNKFDILIDTSISVGNFPNNILFKNNKNVKKKLIFYYIYFLEDGTWKQYSKRKCEYGELIDIRRSEINISNNKTVVVIPSNFEYLENEIETLPSPLSLKKDNCYVADRCSYNFIIDKYVSSYQGEYPHRLANVNKSSFFTFDSLSLNQKKSDSFIILVNIKSEASNKDKGKVCFFNPIKNKLLKNLKISSNSCHIIKMTEINNLKDSNDDLLFITSDSLSFIPIFVNIMKNNSYFELSAEHTHPPTELFWGKNKFQAANQLKKNWIYKNLSELD